MNTHHLKCWPVEFQAIKNGRKTDEFRKDDRNYRVGDFLILREWNPHRKKYSVEEIAVEVTFITRGPHFGIPKGYCVMSIRRTG